MFINKKKKINYLFSYSYYSHVFNTFLMILLSKKNLINRLVIKLRILNLKISIDLTVFCYFN